MIDRTIKLLALSLGVLLIALLGAFFATLFDGPPSPTAAPRAEAEPQHLDASPDDLVTRRVKTITVRPDDQSSQPRNP